MAILSPYIKVTLRGVILGQQWEVGQWYRTNGAAFLTATPEGVGEAWWNDVQADLRDFVPYALQLTLNSVFVEEPGSTGAYGEYPIPAGMRYGMRGNPTDQSSTLLPPFVAAGIRQTVGSRITRPGQKRFPGLLEGDITNGTLTAGTITVLNDVGAKWSSAIILGAPVATGTLTPVVVQTASLLGPVIIAQDVTGYLTAQEPTSQVSRKVGRGI